MADDDAAVKAKLAALEAEVKADASAARARKEAAMAKLREQRAQQLAEREALKERQTALVTKTKVKTKAPEPEPEPAREEEDENDIGGALELAGKANKVRKELAKKPGKGQKSWIASGVASLALGPIGWLYAGSLREAIPASAGWILLAMLVSKVLPAVLLTPVLLVTLPLSALAGIFYAVQYNRRGSRQRLFGDKGQPKQLKSG